MCVCVCMIEREEIVCVCVCQLLMCLSCSLQETNLRKRCILSVPCQYLQHHSLCVCVCVCVCVCRSRRVARLGETHCSCCHPERETTLTLSMACTHSLNCLSICLSVFVCLSVSLSPVDRLPPVRRNPNKAHTGFSRTLSLAMKPQTINPFLTEEEEAEALVTDQAPPTIASLMKYFVPEHSVVDQQSTN